MKLQDILDMWEEDHKINRLDLSNEALKGAKLHAKYLKLYLKVKEKRRELEEEHDTLKLVKSQYYMGRSPDKVYKERPFNLTITKSELPEWLKADDEMRVINRQIDTVKDMQEALTIILDEIRQRDWRIKNALSQIHFEAGG